MKEWDTVNECKQTCSGETNLHFAFYMWYMPHRQYNIYCG